jgi:hypothetical protein
MIRTISAAAATRGALAARRDDLAVQYGEVIRKPKALEEMVWTVYRDGVVRWNGLNIDGADDFISRYFRALPGPLPQRFSFSSDQRTGRSSEIRSRNMVCAEILRTAIAFDIACTNAEFPPAKLPTLELIEFARRQTEEIKHTADLLTITMADEWWTRLDVAAHSQTFNAAQICEWVEAQFERILASNSGKWPRWMEMAAQPDLVRVAA